MELRHLRYFLAVAEEAHFRRAAERLHVSQPTLSLQVQQLEKELGTPLFERMGRRVRLTQAGELYRDYARRALASLEEAQVALDELEGLLRGRLAVGVVQTVNAYLIPPVVAGFVAEHPGVRLRVEELSAEEIEDGLADGNLDLGVSFVPADGGDLEAEPLFEEELVLIVPAGHRWANRRGIRAAELTEEPLALLPEGFCTRRLAEECFRSAGIRPIVAVEMNSVEGLVATVRAGGPPTVLPALAAGGPGIGSLRLERPTPRRTVGLLRRRGGSPLRTRTAFSGAIKAAAVHREGAIT